MNLPDQLVAQFAKATNDTNSGSERTLYGTVVERDGQVYVNLDGSNVLTPAYTTVDTLNGERVIVMIKNHSAIITGNITSPAARSEDLQLIDDNTAEAAKTATSYIKKDDEIGMIFGDLENNSNTGLRLDVNSLRFYIKSAMAVFKPYYEKGDSIDVEWTGSGFVSDSAAKVYFSIPLAKPVIGSAGVTVSSSNGLKIRQNGLYTHGSSSYAKPTYSATISCDGGIVNVVATLSSTSDAVDEAPCGLTASLKIAFS